MKKIIIAALSLVIILVGFTNNANAQKKKKGFQGVITYKIEYSGEELDAATLAMLPKEEIVTILNNKTKTIQDMGMMRRTLITDGENQTMITLIEAGEMKKYVKITADEIKKSLAEDTSAAKITLKDETKEIAGYVCKKGEIVTINEKGEEITSVFYYSEELGCEDINFLSDFRDIDAVIMEYENVYDNGFTEKFTATEVKKSKVSDLEFLVPADFIEFTEEEKQQMKGGEEE